MKYLFLLFGLLLPLNCNAEDVMTIGVGVKSCGKWIEARKNNKAGIYEQWVVGFTSGHNWANQNKQSKPLDADAAWAFIDKFCRNNPLMPITAGAAALVSETGGSKVQFNWSK